MTDKISAIVAESFVVDSIAVYLYPSDGPANHLPVCVQEDEKTASLEPQVCFSQVVCLSVCLSVNTYISYTRHYYSQQYAKNQPVLRQIGPQRSLAKTKSQTADNKLTELLLAPTESALY